MGVAVPDDAVEGEDEDVVAVWDINWRSLLAFLALETQWRVAAGFAGLLWLGIDYAAAAPIIRRRNARSGRRLLADLRVMEREALTVFHEARDEG